MTDTPDQPRKRARVDWPTVRRDYVEGVANDPDGDPTARTWPSLRELAAIHGVTESVVMRRSAREHWPDQRERFQIDCDRQRRERVGSERAAQAASVDKRGLSTADAGLAMVGHRLAYLMGRAAQQPATARAADVQARELSTLALAAWRFVRVKDAVLGVVHADELPDDAALEREQRVEEALLAARLAARDAARVADEALPLDESFAVTPNS